MAYLIGFARCWENNKKVVNHLPLARDFFKLFSCSPIILCGSPIEKAVYCII